MDPTEEETPAWPIELEEYATILGAGETTEMTTTGHVDFGPPSHRDVVWKIAAGGLAVIFAVTFTLQQFRGTHVANQTNSTAVTLVKVDHALAAAMDRIKVETQYLSEVAAYANYLAKDNYAICVKLQTACAAPPSFPDPPGLPALGLPTNP